MLIGKLWASLGMDMTDFENKIKLAESKLKNMSKQMTKTGKDMTTFLTAPLLAFGTGSFMLFETFEKSITKIISLVGLTKSEVESMTKSVLDMASATAKAPAELAEGLFVVTSAGLRGQVALDALNYAAKASAAGLGETKDIARSLAGTINAYGADVMNAARATDVIVATARAGNFEVSQFAGALGRVLPFAQQAGATFEDTGGAIALLTRTNGDAAQSITQMAALFRAFVVPTEEAKKVFDDFGLSAAQLRDMISKQGLPQALQFLDKALNKDREMLGRLLGSSEAASAAFQILEADAYSISETFGVVNKSVGMTDDAFRVVSDTVGFKFQQLLVEGKKALITIGKTVAGAVLPIFEKFINILKNVSEWFTNLSDTQKRWIIGIGAAVAAIGPLLWVFGKLLTVVPLLVTRIKAVSVALSFLSANPVVAIAAGLLAIGTAIYAYATRASEAEKIQKKLNETVKDAVQPLIKEKTEITSLAQLAMQYNEGSEDRVRILKRLNEKYPAFLKNLDIEKTTNKDLAGLITKVNEAYTEKIKVAALEAKQGKAMEEAVRLEGERLDLLQEQALWMDKYNKLRTGQTWGLFAKEDLPEVERKLNDISQSLKENASESALWMAEVQKWGKAYNSAAQSFDKAFGEEEMNNAKGKQEEFSKALSEINEQYKLQVSLARTLFDTKEAEMEKAKALFELYRKFYSEGGYTKDEVEKLKALNAEVEKLSLEMKNLPMGQKGKEGMLAEIEPAVNKAVSDLLKLREAVKSIDESLMDDNAKMEAQYVENVRIIQEAIKRGILSQSEGNVMINKLLDQMIDKNKTIAEDTDTMGKFVKSTWESIGNTIANVMSDMALSLGKALVGAEGSWKESISNILQSLTQLISGLFAAAAAAMISGQMVYSGGMLWGLAAATIGLGALTALWSKNVANLEGMEDGGRVIRGGAFIVGESGPEVVNMAAGTHVTPNYALGDGGYIAETRLKGNDLLILIKRASAQSKRR